MDSSATPSLGTAFSGLEFPSADPEGPRHKIPRRDREMGKMSCWATRYLNIAGGRGSGNGGGRGKSSRQNSRTTAAATVGEIVDVRGCGPDDATEGGHIALTGGEPVDASRSKHDIALSDGCVACRGSSRVLSNATND